MKPFPWLRDRQGLGSRATWIRLVGVCCVLFAGWNGLGADETAAGLASLTVPAGMVVELAAGPPLVEHPMMAGFDPRGRLFIAEAAGRNLARVEIEAELPNFVRMLEDRDGDGRFDKSTIFADRMTFPMGALWHDDALYVASSGAVWRLADRDGDGVADERRQLFKGFGYTGNAADVHGCFLDPCGRIFWCEGRHGHDLRNADGSVLSAGKAARIFSCRPDGSDFRVHCGGGMDNPVEIDFTPSFEMLGTVNLFYRQRGDCLVHWMHGGVYPRQDQPQCIQEFRRTGELLEPVVNFGHVAVSGTMRYRGTQLGEAMRDNFFVTEFNTHRVSRVQLTQDGPTFRAEVIEFLRSSSPDFHPTDVLEDADGSLLVIDTGGWFRNGCPTSQIAKPNLLGAIYRIRRQAAEPVADPRGLKLAWQAAKPAMLADWLSDTRPAVVDQAIEKLAAQGPAAVAVLQPRLNAADERYQLAAVQVLGRLAARDETSAKAALSQLFARETTPATVRRAACYALGWSGDATLWEVLVPGLAATDAGVRRESATALGRLARPEAVPHLLAALQTNPQRVEEHAILYALIEIAAAEPTAAGFVSTDPRIRRGALIALDQMPGSPLTRDQLTAVLDTQDVRLQQTALEILGQHPAWAEEARDWVAGRLGQAKLTTAERSLLRGSLVAFAATPAMQQLAATALLDVKTPAETQEVVLEAIAAASISPLPEPWQKACQQLLQTASPSVAEQAIRALAATNTQSPSLSELLRVRAQDSQQPASLRLAAWDLLRQQRGTLDEPTFQFLVAYLQPTAVPLERMTAARVLSSVELTPAQQLALLPRLKTAGPLELPTLLAAFEAASDRQVQLQLIEVLATHPGLTSLSATQLQKLWSNAPENVREAAAPLLERVAANASQNAERLQTLVKNLQVGDASRGATLFQGSQAACATCHRVASQGGQIGPNLSTIGQSRTARDLLEAILYPSASLARGFESYNVVTNTGQVHTGLIVRETSSAIVVRTADQTEVTIPRVAIDDVQPHAVSIMPAGFAETLTVSQLSDLIAYLQSLK